MKNFLRSTSVLSLLGIVAAASRAGIVYGLNVASTSTTSPGIYVIDDATGAASLVYTATNPENALGYDLATGSFYYESTNEALYRRTATGDTRVATLTGSSNDATVYAGGYYYVVDGTSTLHRIDLTTFVDANLGSVSNLRAAGYGDIASTASGTFYGASDDGFYWGDLGSTSMPVVYIGSNQGIAQLAFDGASLIGLTESTDQVFSIDTATGVRTNLSTLQNRALDIVDLATANPTPEPSALAALGLGAAALLRRRKRA